MNRIDVVIRGAGVLVVAGVLATGAYVVTDGDGQGEFPNTAAANVFVDDSGNDAGENCERYAEPLDTPPTASTVCASLPAAYELAELGDTVWVLPGTYTTNAKIAFNSSNPVTGKTLASNDCHATNECVYFIPQPGQEANVTMGVDPGDGAGGLDVSDDVDHAYFQNFGDGMCPSIGPGGDDVTDITFDNVSGVTGGTAIPRGCKPHIQGHQQYVRILNSEFSYNCISDSSGGWAIMAATGDGESSSTTDTPTNILIEGNYIHDFVINSGGGSCGPADPHQDCIHIYATLNTTIRGNRFDNCHDAHILGQAHDASGVDENMLIENNWFGDTILGANSCCLRGGSPASTETYDGWIIRFNSFTGVMNGKTGYVNAGEGVTWIGNVALGSNSCGASGTVWKYNLYGSGTQCDATDDNTATSGEVQFVSTATGSLDLHVGAGSSVLGYVPGAQANGCSSVGQDYDGAARGEPCDAGADER